MALIAKESGGSSTFTPVPQGMHLARCYRVVDLGTQKSEYLGTIKHLPKVMLQFEVFGEDESGNKEMANQPQPKHLQVLMTWMMTSHFKETYDHNNTYH